MLALKLIICFLLVVGNMASTMPPSSPKPSRGPDEVVPLYCLTRLTSSEEDTLKRKFDEGDKQGLDFVVSSIVPWSNDTDGTETDILRIYKQRENDNYFQFFIDRQTLHDDTIIVVDQDISTLVFSEAAAAEAQQLVQDLHWDSIQYEIDEGLRDAAWDEFRQRAVTYGRVPIADFRSVYANLNLANMASNELVEDPLVQIKDPEWDATAFFRKVEEAKQERDQFEQQQQHSDEL